MLYFGRWRTIGILAIVLLGFIFSIPNLFSAETVATWPSWLPSRQVSLGLDLKGGASLTYQVDRNDFVQKRQRNLVSSIRAELLKDPRFQFTGLGASGNVVQVRITDLSRLAEARTRLTPLRNPINDALLGGQQVYEFDMTSTDDGIIRFTYNPTGFTQQLRNIVTQSVQVIERRVNALGTKETSVQSEGDDRILVEAPGLTDTTQLKGIVGSVAQMTFHMVQSTVPTAQADSARQPGSDVYVGQDDPNTSYVVDSQVLMTGDDLADAQASFDQRTNEPIVNFRLNGNGARKFGQITQQNVGRPFAIVLDDKVLSAPVIREPILGGSGQISGNFTVQQTNDLAILLRAGALPAKLTIIEERTVGPSLGADSIRAGVIASIVATLAIAFFMIVCYGLLGVFAVLALIGQNALMLAILSLLGATLTLPGIAGIVLTMGMAVDANVLIYERMREEAHAGRSVMAALDTGFTKALATIIDAHLTALIAAIALFTLGSGPIRGFAVTLAIGIVSTLFTAYLVTRLIVSIWARTTRPKAIPL